MSDESRPRDRAESGVAILERRNPDEHLSNAVADRPLRRDRTARGIANDGPSAAPPSTRPIHPAIGSATKVDDEALTASTVAERPTGSISAMGATPVPVSPPIRVAVPTTPPGWYPDPADTRGLRWWTGIGWTAHTTSVAPGGASTVPERATSVFGGATAQAAGASAPTGDEQHPARNASNSVAGTTSAALSTAGALTNALSGADSADSNATGVADDDRSGHRLDARRIPSVFTPLGPTRVHTLAVWILALTPLISAIGEHAIVGSLLPYSALTIRIAYVATIIVFSLVLAFVDRARLGDGWHSDTASPWWVLLTPFAYLVGRTVRVRQETGVRATGMSLIWLLMMLPAVAIAFGWDGIGPVVEMLERI